VLIAICALTLHIDLAERVYNESKRVRAWHGYLVAPLPWEQAFGPMHYTGMLAYRFTSAGLLPCATVILSMMAAIGASFGSAFHCKRPRISALHVVAGSLPDGHGHFRHALYRNGRHEAAGNAPLGHVVCDHIGGDRKWQSLWQRKGLTYLFRGDERDNSLKIVCSNIMGFAIPAMHYTACCRHLHVNDGNSRHDVCFGYFRTGQPPSS